MLATHKHTHVHSSYTHRNAHFPAPKSPPPHPHIPPLFFLFFQAQGALTNWKTSILQQDTTYERKKTHTYTHTCTGSVCTKKTLGWINKNMNNKQQQKEDNAEKKLTDSEEERRGRSFVESPNSRRRCLLDCICLLFNVLSLSRNWV